MRGKRRQDGRGREGRLAHSRIGKARMKGGERREEKNTGRGKRCLSVGGGAMRGQREKVWAGKGKESMLAHVIGGERHR